MTGPSAFDDRDRVLVAALAAGSTQAEAADIAGCSTRTLRRRLAVEAVQADLRAERSRLAQETADALTGRSRAAVARLSDIIARGSDRDAVAAARVMLDSVVKHRDAVYVADRLAEAEDAIAAHRVTA